MKAGLLEEWLRREGLARGGERIEITPLAGGQSNPTYRIRAGDGDYVLRKKPPGALLPSAHAIDREYRVMQALAGSQVPVPRMLAWCDDESVTGTAFYLMEFLDGRMFPDPALPGIAPVERAAIYREMNRVIAALHRVDVDAVGLANFGRPGNYVQRQVQRWVGQCERATVPLPPGMRELMAWLPANVPQGARTSLVHGDFRIDNLVFHPTEPRVIGVLDWELSTLGDPVADFSYHCMAWRIAPDVWRGIGGLPLHELGIPGEREYVRAWEEATGFAAADWEFYMAYNLFRIAAILHGIAQRAADGSAAAPNAAEQGARAGALARLALSIAAG